MKKAASLMVMILILFLPSVIQAESIPIFNMPPDNYPLFSYGYTKPAQTQTQRAIEKKPAGINIQIRGVFSSSKGSYVLVNHKIYREGDTINGYKIVKITPEEVVFKKGKKTYTQKLENTKGIIFFDHKVVSDNSS